MEPDDKEKVQLQIESNWSMARLSAGRHILRFMPNKQQWFIIKTLFNRCEPTVEQVNQALAIKKIGLRWSIQ